MKILIFNWRDIKNPSAGGAEVVTHMHAKRWVGMGHRVTLFTTTFPKSKARETIDGVNIIRRGNKCTVYWHAFCYYRKYFRGNFDLIVDEINTLPFFTPLYVKEPIVTLIHQLCEKIWFYESKLPIAIVGYSIEPFCLKIYRKISVMTVSQSSRKNLLRLGFREERVHIIPEGIDFRPLVRVSKKEEYPTLVYVGRLKRSKRIHHILKAFKIIKRGKPTARLWLIGNGDSYKKKLEKLIRRMGLRDVIFWGFQQEKEKLSLIGRAHLIVMTSVKEGWGLVITEANAVGTPAVIYNVDGLRDSTQDQVTGLVCPVDNPSSLAKTILKLLNDEQLRKKLSENALNYSRQFSWEKSAEESLKIIERVAKNRRKK